MEKSISWLITTNVGKNNVIALKVIPIKCEYHSHIVTVNHKTVYLLFDKSKGVDKIYDLIRDIIKVKF